MEARQFIRTQNVDVVIVGGGISGLTTAMKILQKESALQIKILEASSAMGGQVRETFLGEIAGRWITEQQYHIWQLVQQLQIPITKRVVLAPTLKRCWDLDRGFWAPLAKFEVRRYIAAIELRLRDYLPERRKLREKSPSMYAHIHSKLFFRQSRKFLMSVVELISGTAPQYINYAAFMSICSSHGGLTRLIQLYVECPNDLLEINSTRLVYALLEKIKSVDLLVCRRVLELHQYRNYVEIRDSAYELHTAEVVVLAVPWENMRDIIITPSLPDELQQPSMPPDRHRVILTSMLARYAEAHWRNAGYSGSLMCNSMSLPLLIGYEYRPAIYAALLMHDEDEHDGGWMRPLVLDLLAQHFGDGMKLPNDYTECTYALPSLAHLPFTTPWRRIIFSTASSATSYRGCLSGAVQSAQRAAVNVLLQLRPQNLSWQDIAEIHCTASSETIFPSVSWPRLWLSTLNLYNVSYYSLLTICTVIVVRLAHKRIAPNLQ